MKAVELSKSQVVRHLFFSVLALLFVLLVGTVGYRLLGGEDYSWVDCFYMTFITISTIGFTESVDVSHYEYGKLFTVLVGVFGIGMMGYVLSTFTAFMLESDLNIEWRKTKMRQKIAKLEGHYIICGVGRVGGNVVTELKKTGRTCVLIDEDLSHIESCVLKYPDVFYVHGDATDNDVLIEAGISKAIGVFAVAQDDSQNLVISLSAKQLNPNLRVVARCHEVKNVEKTLRAGADEIVSPDFTGGLRLVSAMVRPHVVSFLDEMLKSEDNLRLEEVTISSAFDGKQLNMISQDRDEFIVLAIQQQHKNWLFRPSGEQVLYDGDVMMVMTTPEGRNKLEQLIQSVA